MTPCAAFYVKPLYLVSSFNYWSIRTIFQNGTKSCCLGQFSSFLILAFFYKRRQSMAPTEQPVLHRVLLVDDDDAVRAMMNATLEHKGFEVVAAASVTE